MKNTKEMPFVRFPHYAHTLWLDCSNCHPAPFEPRSGSTSITMADIFRGKYCGMCHDRVAFITFFSCQRCHSVPQPGGLAPSGSAPYPKQGFATRPEKSALATRRTARSSGMNIAWFLTNFRVNLAESTR
jgi:c(7)-type cytochrome triheme protein